MSEDGWIDWTGGRQPVSDTQNVDIRRRNGNASSGEARHFYWGRWPQLSPNRSLDIIAYRIVEESNG